MRDAKILELATYFIEERGNTEGVDGMHYYDVEAEKRGESENERPTYYPERRSYWYQQAHLPIISQQTVEGHSVRAMYLLTAVADLSFIDPQHFGQRYTPALERLWGNMVDCKMYLTGGVGAIEQWEGFGIDYFLPQGTDEGGWYAETCAATGVVMLAERMLQTSLDGKYADIMELCLYNAVLTGMSLDGKAFTYVNQLASSPSHPSKREEWFECACCPPNMTRVLGYLGGYLWSSEATSTHSAEINVHLYTSATLTVPIARGEIQLRQTTDWPWSGDMDFEIIGAKDVEVTIRLRIPAWAEGFEISPTLPSLALEKNYLTLPLSYTAQNPKFNISIPMRPRLITPHPFTNQPVAAVARGPIVYCVEDADNDWVTDHFKSVVFDTRVALMESMADMPCSSSSSSTDGETEKETYLDITAVDAARFLRMPGGKGPFVSTNPGSRAGTWEVEAGRKETLRFVPYYVRANRGGRGMMRVGLRVGGGIGIGIGGFD